MDYICGETATDKLKTFYEMTVEKWSRQLAFKALLDCFVSLCVSVHAFKSTQKRQGEVSMGLEY